VFLILRPYENEVVKSTMFPHRNIHKYMCLNETYSKVRIGKYLSDSFPVQNGLKQGDALSPLLRTLL
jgi:hypothetical protein